MDIVAQKKENSKRYLPHAVSTKERASNCTEQAATIVVIHVGKWRMPSDIAQYYDDFTIIYE